MKIDPRQRTLDLEVGYFIPQPEDFTALRNLISKAPDVKPQNTENHERRIETGTGREGAV